MNVPVKFQVKDIRKLKERKAEKESFCAVHFTASEVLAACAVFSGDGHVTDSYFVRGGKEFAYRRKRLLNRMKKIRKNQKVHLMMQMFGQGLQLFLQDHFLMLFLHFCYL